MGRAEVEVHVGISGKLSDSPTTSAEVIDRLEEKQNRRHLSLLEKLPQARTR